MVMTFNYPNPHLPMTQSTDEYVSFSPVFSMELGDGYLSVLDDVDDAMMLHEVYFEGMEKEHDANVEDMRIVWVIRRLENKWYFYADTSTIVLSPEKIATSNSNSTMIPTMPRRGFHVKCRFHVKVVMSLLILVDVVCIVVVDVWPSMHLNHYLYEITSPTLAPLGWG
jgi:hypothetical protein